MNKKAWIWSAVTGLAMAGLVAAGYSWGMYDSQRVISHRVTVRCAKPVNFQWKVPDRKEPTDLVCTPDWPVEIRGTENGDIVLP